MSNENRHPLPEEYSRVTNPERFRPLHALAIDLADHLAAEYDVTVTDSFTGLPDAPSFEHARAPVTLTPVAPEAAPIAIAFTPYPGLVVRCGRWLEDYFPACGCDACAETAAGEGERLEELVGDVIAGQFHEEVTVPFFGQATLRWTLGDLATRWRGGGVFVTRARGRSLRNGGPKRMQWQPWPKRLANARPS